MYADNPNLPFVYTAHETFMLAAMPVAANPFVSATEIDSRTVARTIMFDNSGKMK